MGFLDSLKKLAPTILGAVGTAIAPGVGTAVGSGLGKLISGSGEESNSSVPTNPLQTQNNPFASGLTALSSTINGGQAGIGNLINLINGLTKFPF